MCGLIVYPKGFGDEVDGLDEAVMDVTLYKHYLYTSCFKYFRLDGLCSYNISILFLTQ